MSKYFLYPSAFQDLINKINRVPFSSEAADKGTAFGEIVDMVAHKGFNLGEKVSHKGFDFKKEIVEQIAEEIKGAAPQVLCKGFLQTPCGEVFLYGYIDELLPMHCVDVKTTASYDTGKYLKNWQHIVYPFCLYQTTSVEYPFTYLVTDFQRIYIESYQFNFERDVALLKYFVEDFITFIEQHKHLITDTKIFTGKK